MPIELTHRPHRPDDRHGRGQCAAAGGAGRARRARSAAVRRRDGASHTATRWAAARRACGSPWSRKVSAIRNRGRDRHAGARGGRSVPRPRRRRSRRCRSRCTARARAIWLPIAAEGATVQMMQGNGFGFNWQGLYVTSLMDFHSAWRSAGRRAVRHAQEHDAARPLHGHQPSRPLLRQGAEPGAPAARAPTTRCWRTTTCC